jgi:hypothetical protein
MLFAELHQSLLLLALDLLMAGFLHPLKLELLFGIHLLGY